MTLSANLAAQLDAVALAWALPDGAALTPEQRRILTAFHGWGGLAPAFGSAPTGQWLEAADRLDERVPAAALAAAREQVDTSFFTPRHVAAAVYDLLRSVGFTGGEVLEPGCGSGLFMEAAPDEFDIRWTGVEIDPTSARIAKLLHPEAAILTGKLEETALRDEHFDAVVGNVPFSGVRVWDRQGRGGSLHNYFIRRAVDAVRPGGYVILITSRFTIDSEHGLAETIAELPDAAFVGAIRLPAGAFKDSGTDVVTDVLVIRRNDDVKRLPSWPVGPDFELGKSEIDWRGGVTFPRIDRRTEVTAPAAGIDPSQIQPVRVSRYWGEHPEHVVGQMRVTTNPRNPLTVEGALDDTAVAAVVTSLAGRLPALSARVDPADLGDIALTDADGRKEGSFHVIDGTMHKVTGGKLTPIRANKELEALIGLRDLAVQLLDAESDTHLPDTAIAPLRGRTRDAYEAYVARFGNLNRGTLVEGAVDDETGLPALSWRRPAMGGFRRDPDAALVLALEVFDQDTSEAGPAPILLRRVNRAPEPVAHVDTPVEALAVSLGEAGIVDLDRIAGLLGLPSAAAALAALGDLVFEEDGHLVPAAQFLSGDVRAKLARAEATGDERAAAALRAVVPADLGPMEISLNLGSPLLTPADVEAFLKEEIGVGYPSVAHQPTLGVWEVDEGHCNYEARLAYGTSDAAPTYLVECALNARMPEITDRHWDSNRRTWVQVRNTQKSAAANEKLEAIRDRFSTWVWEDKDRADRLCALYNRKLNAHVARAYSGAGLTFPGLSDGVTPWPHQRAAVERAITTDRTLIAHPVGAGKTLSMCLTARTLRQFGLANKPLIVVPNHLLEQVSREAQQAFPTGRFLIASKDDLARDARRLFAARCATGDWDAVIMTHSSFTAIPVHPDSEKGWITEEKLDLQAAMNTSVGGRKDKGAKAIARAVRALDSRIGKLRQNTLTDPDAIWFEQLGIDYIMYDECFPWETPVVTDRGELPIGQIVDEALDVRIASANLATGEIEYKPIHRWIRKERPDELVRIRHEHGELVCTANHPIWVEGSGYVAAGHLRPGETLRILRGAPGGRSAEALLQHRASGSGFAASSVGHAGVCDLRRDVHPGVRVGDDVQPSVWGEGGGGSAAEDGQIVHSLRSEVHRDNDETEVLRCGVRGVCISGDRSREDRKHARRDLRGLWSTVSSAQLTESGLFRSVPDKAIRPSEVSDGRMHALREDIRADEAEPEVLLEEMRESGTHGRRGRQGFSRADASYLSSAAYLRRGASSITPADAGTQPDARPGSESEDAVFAPGQDVLVSWWERDLDGAAIACRGAARDAHGVLYSDPAGLGSVRVVAELLQGRSGVPRREAGGRGRREVASHQEVEIPRSSEDSGLGISRVVSVEVLERGGAVRHGARGEVDSLRDGAVYNLEVADNHNYIADGVLVSNCHIARRLATGSTSRDNGFGSGSSKRATDLLVKAETLAARRPAGAPVLGLFSGTPWSNTLAETWVWQRFLQPDTLRELDLLAFDAWVSAFIRYETSIEVAPDGSGFRMQRRPVGVVNAPELKMLLAQVADILDPASLGIDRPDHTVQTVVVEPTDQQREFVRGLAERADAIRSKTADQRQKKDGGVTDDSMLLVCNDGRKVALDPRLVGIDERSTKIERTAELIAAEYHANRDRTFAAHPVPGAFQLAFLDLGTPKPGESSTYGRLRRAVVDRGVPAHMVRFVHEATTDKARAALFAACRDGEVALLVASTEKAGMGTNVQTRLTHLIHLDGPWLPSSVTQRDGRAIRPHNHSGHVTITRMVTEGTFDAYTWQALERKSRSFDALYATGATAREIEDVSSATISYGQVKALASGNPLLLDQATVRAQVKKLQLMRSVHRQSIRKAEDDARRLTEHAEAWVRTADKLDRAARELDRRVATDADRDALTSVVAGWLDRTRNAGYVPSYALRTPAMFRGMTVRPKHEGTRLIGITLDHAYATLRDVVIVPKLARRGAPVISDFIAQTVDRFVDGIDEAIADARAKAAEHAAQAEQASTAAAHAVFPDEDALQAAVARLATIDALIAADAEQAAAPMPVAA